MSTALAGQTNASHSLSRVTSQYVTLVPQLLDFHPPNREVRHVDPTNLLQVVVIASSCRRKAESPPMEKMPHCRACNQGRLD